MTVAVLYTEPGNKDCDLTRKALRGAGIAYEEINVRKDDEALAFVLHELGHEAFPVVWFDRFLHWSGHSVDRIKAAARTL